MFIVKSKRLKFTNVLKKALTKFLLFATLFFAQTTHYKNINVSYLQSKQKTFKVVKLKQFFKPIQTDAYQTRFLSNFFEK